MPNYAQRFGLARVLPFADGLAGPLPVAAPVNTVAPAITGTAQEGQVLTASQGTWSNSPTGYSYQWKVGGVNAGVNSPNYTPVTADVGKTATCTVTATNGAGSTTATSAATSAISAASGGPGATALTLNGQAITLNSQPITKAA